VQPSVKSGQYVVEGGEAHGVAIGACFTVYADSTMTSVLGTVTVIQLSPFKCVCIPKDDEEPFQLSDDAVALQTHAGERDGIRLLIEADPKLDVFRQVAREMIESGEYGLHIVDDVNGQPDLAVHLNGKTVRFEIMPQAYRQQGLTRMPFDIRVNDTNLVQRILQSAAYFYWHLNRTAKSKLIDRGSNITVECFVLRESGRLSHNFEAALMPYGENLNVGGVITINVDDDERYGFKISNNTSVELYASMFYFDLSDLSIGASWTVLWKQVSH